MMTRCPGAGWRRLSCGHTGTKSTHLGARLGWMIRGVPIRRMKIVVDVGERRSGVPRLLSELGLEVGEERLVAGDYRLGGTCLVERKTVSDLHRSIASGRLWRQLEAIRREGETGWLLIEGQGLDRGQLSRAGIRGAVLAVVDTGLPVIWTQGPSDSAQWLAALAQREARRSVGDTHWKMRRGRTRPSTTPDQLLSSIPGISPGTAQRLLDEFGSIQGVSDQRGGELKSIPGIGDVRARTIERLLGGGDATSMEESP